MTHPEFTALFEADFDRLYRYAMRYLRSAADAKDVVQDVFLTLWEGQHPIPRPVLYTMTRHRCFNLLKRQRVRTRHQDRVPVPTEPVTPAEELAERDLAAAIQAAVDALAPQQRRVIELRWHEHLSRAEIADRLGIAEKTVGIHVGRALAHLRERLPDFVGVGNTLPRKGPNCGISTPP